MLSAEETGAAVAAVAADTGGGQLAYITRSDRRLVARNHHRLFGDSVGEAGKTDDEFRTRTEVVYIVETVADRSKDLSHSGTHARPAAAGGVKLTQVMTGPERIIDLSEA